VNPIGFHMDSNGIPEPFLASRGHAYAHPVPNPYPSPTAITRPNVVAGPSTGMMRHKRLFRFQGFGQRSMTTIDRRSRG
jgi:hypothetical protein